MTYNYRPEARRKRGYDKHRDSLIHLIREYECKVVVEVGVYRCLTAIRVLKDLGSILDSYLMVDPWQPFGVPGAAGEDDAGCPKGVPWEKHFRTAKQLEMQYQCASLLRTTSVEAASMLDPESVDLVFIDADHSYKAVKADIEAWLPIVKPDGILAGHDYYRRWPGVVRAVDEAFPYESLEFLPDTVWYAFVANCG